MAPDILAGSALAAQASCIQDTVVTDPTQSLEIDPSKFKITRQMVGPLSEEQKALPLKEAETEIGTVNSKAVKKFSILQYNVLITQIDVEPKYYYCPAYAQGWEYRGPNLVREMREYNSDIIACRRWINMIFSRKN